MSEPTRREFLRGAVGSVAAFGLGCLASASAAFAADATFREAGDFAVYLGVAPAAIVKGHPVGHVERQMHDGVPAGRHEYHVVIAILDRVSGERINDAQVTATISGEGHVGGSPIKLEPMEIADTMTYGNFVALPGRDRYTIAVAIRRPGQSRPTEVTFSYRHGPE